ncbi:hypothetical protein GCM10011273_18640 [Asticcacaulis endophyticus]|uniref:Uncharacterized protein n=1 Tax=Asticcacaulis endophyticus TaxID=1395890 RepID=A0A918UTW8_9CAUL|nr:hypothetical protein GCM10011273_18640 [Asticcacaulis endophyticus]
MADTGLGQANPVTCPGDMAFRHEGIEHLQEVKVEPGDMNLAHIKPYQNELE